MPKIRPLERYKSVVAYDGTDFQGFQRQGLKRRTVQGVLEQALRDLGWQGKSILAAGRTDSGVHARGQVVAFELCWSRGPWRLTQALNARLPHDVAVWQTERCPAGFHPRFSAVSRHYRYTLIASPLRDPLRERFAWRVWPAPELEPMEQAARRLIGEHDFGAFGRSPSSAGDTRRRVWHAQWRQHAEGFCFDIVADAFLYRMVRHLISAMLEIGRGRLDATQISEMLRAPNRRWQGSLPAASGLCLEAVSYGEPHGEEEGANSEAAWKHVTGHSVIPMT